MRVGGNRDLPNQGDSRMNLNTNGINDKIAERFSSLKKNHDVAADKNGDAMIGTHRFNIMGADYFMADMLHDLKEIYGDGAGAIMKSTGQSYGENIHGVLDGAENASDSLGYDLGLLKYLGYSNITVENDEITVESSPTAESYKRKYDDQLKSCFFLSGVFQSLIQEHDEDASVQEVKCLADGAEKCIFKVETGQ